MPCPEAGAVSGFSVTNVDGGMHCVPPSPRRRPWRAGLVFIVWLAHGCGGSPHTDPDPVGGGSGGGGGGGGGGTTVIVGPPLPTPVPVPSSDPLAGLYTLAVTATSECPGIPAAAMSRTYSAAVDPTGADTFRVTLGDATFLLGDICSGFSGIGCHQFTASRNGATWTVNLGSAEDQGGKIIEHIAPGNWAYYTGSGSAPVTSPDLQMTLNGGGIWACPTLQQAPFPCDTFQHCSSNLRLTFTRR